MSDPAPDQIEIYSQPIMGMPDGHRRLIWTPAMIQEHLKLIRAPLRVRFVFWLKSRIYGARRSFSVKYRPWLIFGPFYEIHYNAWHDPSEIVGWIESCGGKP